MKKYYETPSVEKISFRYRDQVVAASGGNTTPQTGGNNFWESNEFGSCYDLGDLGQVLLESWLGNCDWINRG